MERLKGKTALITGGTSGIGLATAKLFLAEGARVAVTGRDQERLSAAQKELGGDTLVIRSEAGNLAEIDSLMEQVKTSFGQLDILFLNAASGTPGPIEMVSEEQFDEIVDICFKGIFFSIQKALPLLSGNSSIIITSSIVNKTGSPNFSVYGASKAALRSLVQSLGLSLISRGIRVNAINPGPIDTGGFNRLPVPPEMFQAIKNNIIDRSPSKRLGTPEEVAKVALFLASDDSTFVVGEEIVVDGGMTLVCLP